MLKTMENLTRTETFTLDPSLGQVQAFTREKTKRLVSRNIDDKVEDLTNYKKRAEMLERKETLNFSSTKGKEICTSSQTLEDNPREHAGRVPPNSPNIQEFEFDCWDYFSSIFFQLFPGDPDEKRRDFRPKSEGFCKDKSLYMWKEMEWRASREKLRKSITRSKIYDDGDNLPFSEGQTSSKQEEIFEKPKKKLSVDEQREINAAEKDYEVKKSNNGRQSNRYKLVLPEKPRNPFLRKTLINRERTTNAEVFKSMEKTYEDIKKLKPGEEKRKQILAFTKDNTCSVYFSQTKHDRQSVPVRGLNCTANIIPKAIQKENSDASDVIQTGDVDRKCLLGKKFDDEVKECLVTCSFRLSNKSEKKKSDIPKDVERNKVSYPQNKIAKRNKKQDESFQKKSNDEGHGQKEILVSSPKLSENILGRRNSLLTEKKKADKMSKYRKNSKEQDFLENSQVLELKTKQFEFPAFQKSELLVDQVKRVTFAPLPILMSKFTYENKDYDAWSRSDKKTAVKPIELKWKM